MSETSVALVRLDSKPNAKGCHFKFSSPDAPIEHLAPLFVQLPTYQASFLISIIFVHLVRRTSITDHVSRKRF